MTTPETHAGQAVRSNPLLAVGDTLLGDFGSNVLLGEVIANVGVDQNKLRPWADDEIVNLYEKEKKHGPSQVNAEAT